MPDKHERIGGIVPGLTPDIGHKASDDEGHTGYGRTQAEAEEALRVAQDNDVDRAEKDTRPIVGALLPGYVLGNKLKAEEPLSSSEEEIEEGLRTDARSVVRPQHDLESNAVAESGSQVIGKIIGFVIVVAAVIWFVFAIAIPLAVINIAVLTLIAAAARKELSKLLLPVSAAGAILVIADFNLGWFTRSLAANVSFFAGLIPGLFYLNVLAGLIAAYLLVRNLLNSRTPPPDRTGEFTRRNLITMGCLFLVGGLAVGLSHRPGQGPSIDRSVIGPSPSIETTSPSPPPSPGARRHVSFVQGHGEHDTADPSPQGYSTIAKALKADNLEISEVTLAQEGTVPDDATLVVVAGPKTDYLAHEVEALRVFLKGGGSLLLLVDPPEKADSPQATNLIAFAREWDVDLGNNVVIDMSGKGQLLGANAATPIGMPTSEGHAITRNFQLMTGFPIARSATPIEGGANGHVAHRLIVTSAQSWAETDLKGLYDGGKPELNSDKGDVGGPVSLAATVSAVAFDKPPASSLDRPRPETRVVIVGDSDFLSNGALRIPGNQQFGLNLASWLLPRSGADGEATQAAKGAQGSQSRETPAPAATAAQAAPQTGEVCANHILFKTYGKDEATVRQAAEAVLKQVRAGGDFEALAKKYSEDLPNGQAGGDVGCFGHGKMVKEFEDAAFALTPGQVSDLVRTQFGYHIIKVRAPHLRPNSSELSGPGELSARIDNSSWRRPAMRR